MTLSVGDRIDTRDGRGTVTEVVGDRLFVDMDNPERRGDRYFRKRKRVFWLRQGGVRLLTPVELLAELDDG